MNAITTTIQSAADAPQAQSLRQYNAEAAARNPAAVSWSPTLLVELALKTASPQELKEHYGYSDEDWLVLRANPVFLSELAAACEEVKKDGVSFKMKARLQAEAMLETSWRLVHAPSSEVPANVKSDLIKTTFRIAGFDNKEAAAGTGGTALNIQINL